MNLQELETIAFHEIPAKIFVLNDEGYLAISNTQRRWFGNRLEGSDFHGGLSTPNFLALAKSFGIPAEKLDVPNGPDQVEDFLKSPGTRLMDVPIPRNQSLMPRMDSRIEGGQIVSPPLHDMYPFLERDVLHRQISRLRGSLEA